MQKVIQLLADNTSGVLSRISGLFTRRGYNIESITAGVTADPRFSRVTITTSGDEDVLEQIVKQVYKLVDVRDLRVLDPEESVYRELVLIKVKADKNERLEIQSIAQDVFRARIIDMSQDSVIVELVGSPSKVSALIKLLEDYEILEIARTGITGLQRGTENVIELD